MNQQYSIFPINKRKIQRQYFQKPQKLNITGVPFAYKYLSSKNLSFGFHSIVNICKHGKLAN